MIQSPFLQAVTRIYYADEQKSTAKVGQRNSRDYKN
jgi:hypothetical protein